MRFTDIIMCFPTFLLIITVASVLPPNIFNIMVIIGIFGWPGMTRLIRGQFLSLRSQDFVHGGGRDRRTDPNASFSGTFCPTWSARWWWRRRWGWPARS